MADSPVSERGQDLSQSQPLCPSIVAVFYSVRGLGGDAPALMQQVNPSLCLWGIIIIHLCHGAEHPDFPPKKKKKNTCTVKKIFHLLDNKKIYSQVPSVRPNQGSEKTNVLASFCQIQVKMFLVLLYIRVKHLYILQSVCQSWKVFKKLNLVSSLEEKKNCWQ